MTRIKQVFDKLKSVNKKAFVAFITAGDPDYQTSLNILKKLPENGVDVIELGVPFLDPAGDGPVIELAGKRAVEAGMNLKKVLQMVAEFREVNQTTPIILMGYYNPILKYGLENFTKDAAKNGVDGFLIVDLPPEEESDLRKFADQDNLDLIRLIAPTSNSERMEKIVKKSSGFLYLVSILGITGTKSANHEENKIQVEKIRKLTNLPVAIGFGVKTADEASEILKTGADGVVVGSKFVGIIADNLQNNSQPEIIVKNVLQEVQKFSKAIKDV